MTVPFLRHDTKVICNKECKNDTLNENDKTESDGAETICFAVVDCSALCQLGRLGRRASLLTANR